MHTFRSQDKYNFHHNGDFSGSVFITKDDDPSFEVEVSGQALLEYSRYVAESILTETIESIMLE